MYNSDVLSLVAIRNKNYNEHYYSILVNKDDRQTFYLTALLTRAFLSKQNLISF